jgi:hypothetical protein
MELPFLPFATLKANIHYIFDKPVDEPLFDVMYVDLCVRLSTSSPSPFLCA